MVNGLWFDNAQIGMQRKLLMIMATFEEAMVTIQRTPIQNEH